jgi:predicted nucleotidyltransferase
VTRTVQSVIKSLKFKNILKINRVKKIALFGSHANGSARFRSDIDFLVDFEDGADLFDQISLKDDLQRLFKKKVDVVTRAGLTKYIRAGILKGAVDL